MCVCVWGGGDAQDVGSVKAGQPRALTLSKEHLAVFPQERARIEKAGGYVSADGRLNGRMQVARSFGDVQLKQVGEGWVGVGAREGEGRGSRWCAAFGIQCVFGSMPPQRRPLLCETCLRVCAGGVLRHAGRDGV